MYKTYVMFSNIFISPLKNVEKMWFAFVFASVSVHGKHFDIQTFVVEIILATIADKMLTHCLQMGFLREKAVCSPPLSPPFNVVVFVTV